ncbi:MAG: cell division protein FtsQ/DivIB [Bdellovibrionota bacterium]
MLGWLGYEQYSGDSRISNSLIESLHNKSEEFLYQKTIDFKGLSLLSELDIERYLPHEKSVLWWVFNRSQVEAEIASHSLVAKSSIELCSWLRPACYLVKITERIPTFIALSDTDAWVVADDGAFVSPIPVDKVERAMFKREDKTYKKPPLVDGLFTNENSPEVSLARSAYINDSIIEIERATAKSIESITVKDNGELEISLRNTDYTIVFDKTYGDQAKLEDQLARLAKVLEQFENRERTIKSIDLAFNSLAVVRLKEKEKSEKSVR